METDELETEGLDTGELETDDSDADGVGVPISPILLKGIIRVEGVGVDINGTDCAGGAVGVDTVRGAIGILIRTGIKGVDISKFEIILKRLFYFKNHF